MEGAATLFAIEFCKHRGVSTTVWEALFDEDSKDPYALSYSMMRDLKAALPQSYPILLHTTQQIRLGEAWQRIDIERWLQALSDSERATALASMRPYAAQLHKHRRSAVRFTMPQALDERR